MGWTAVLVAALAAICTDYLMFQGAKRRAISVVSELGGKAGSIGGWPLGEENVITFERDLNDEEIQRLKVLNGLSSRHYVGIYFRNCNVPDKRLIQLRRHLNKCQVHMEQPKGQQTSCAERMSPLAISEVARLARLPIPASAMNVQYGTENGLDQLIYGRFDLPASEVEAFLARLPKGSTLVPDNGYSNVTSHAMSEPWWTPGKLVSRKIAEWSEPGFSGNLLMGTGEKGEMTTVYFFNFTL